MKMRTVKVGNWKALERHSLSAEYPDLPAAVRAQMREGLKRHGLVGDRGITLYERKVLDGWQLLQACIEEDIEPPFWELPQGIEPAEFVEIMNDRRRHENMETMRLRAEKRRQRVVAARQRGRSTRAIARAEDVSERTIRNDLATATAEGTQLPPTITGLDGKVRPAQKHRLIPELAEREYSPKVLPLLEALPRGTQLDIARLVTGGVHIRDAIRQVQHQREPGDDSAQIEADNAAQKAKPKNGTALFDWRRFHADWGALLRQVDALGNAYRCKESPAAEELRNELAQWKERFKGLYRSVAQQEAPKE